MFTHGGNVYSRFRSGFAIAMSLLLSVTAARLRSVAAKVHVYLQTMIVAVSGVQDNVEMSQ